MRLDYNLTSFLSSSRVIYFLSHKSSEFLFWKLSSRPYGMSRLLIESENDRCSFVHYFYVSLETFLQNKKIYAMISSRPGLDVVQTFGW